MFASNVSPSHELRRHPRSLVSGPVTVGWTDAAGVNRISRGKYVNASETGVCLELRDPLPERGFINFRCEGLRLSGSGSVRHCGRKQMTWTVGVEFCGGLSWRPSACG